MSMKPMREARKGDRALVVGVPSTSPMSCYNGAIVNVLSDPYVIGKSSGLFNNTDAKDYGANLAKAAPHLVERHAMHAPVPTDMLMPIDPDDDTRQAFEAEARQDARSKPVSA